MAETLLISAVNSGAMTAGTASTIGMSSTFAALPTIGSTLSLISAGSSIMGGFQQAGAYKAQAQQAELAARTEELRGREQADKVRRGLQATLASQNAAFAARGISINSGTPVNIGNVSRTEAAADIEAAQFGAGTSAGAYRSRADIYRAYGSSSVTSGFANAFAPIRRSLYA